MRLKEILSETVVTTSPATSIDEAIQLMKLHQVRHLPVAVDGWPIGMVSLGDVMLHVGELLREERVSTRDATVECAGPTTVEQIMTPKVVSLKPEDAATEACRVMLESGIAGVIVVDGGRICGIVSETDLLKRFFADGPQLPASCRQQKVADLMSTDIITATPREGVFALIRKMAQRIHHVPVVDNGKLVGLVSAHDVQRALALDKVKAVQEAAPGIRIMGEFDAGKIMTANPETATPETTVADAARRMVTQKIGCLPIVESEELVGILTETDLLRACAAALEGC